MVKLPAKSLTERVGVSGNSDDDAILLTVIEMWCAYYAKADACDNAFGKSAGAVCSRYKQIAYTMVSDWVKKAGVDKWLSEDARGEASKLGIDEQRVLALRHEDLLKKLDTVVDKL